MKHANNQSQASEHAEKRRENEDSIPGFLASLSIPSGLFRGFCCQLSWDSRLRLSEPSAKVKRGAGECVSWDQIQWAGGLVDLAVAGVVALGCVLGVLVSKARAKCAGR